mgnify:CR=1 FL=1
MKIVLLSLFIATNLIATEIKLVQENQKLENQENTKE